MTWSRWLLLIAKLGIWFLVLASASVSATKSLEQQEACSSHNHGKEVVSNYLVSESKSDSSTAVLGYKHVWPVSNFIMKELGGNPKVYIWDGQVPWIRVQERSLLTTQLLASCFFSRLPRLLTLTERPQLHHISTFPEPNPDMGHLAWADAFVVTANSVSMISEVCSTGKPVYLMGGEHCKWKLCDFQKSLQERGMVRPFKGLENISESWSYPALNETAEAASRVHEALAERGWRLRA